MKYYKISIMLIFFLILSIGAISAESVDDGVLSSSDSIDDNLLSVDDGVLSSSDSLDDNLLASDSIDDSISDDIMESQEENAISQQNSEENLQEGIKTFTQLNEDINVINPNISLTSSYKYDNASDGELKYGIEIADRKFTLEGNGNVIDADNQAGVFIFRNSNVIIKNLKVINAINAFYIADGSNITTINLVFENNTDPDSGAAVYVHESCYNSSHDTFKNNRAPLGSSIFLTSSSNATISNSTFINDEEIEWALIYSDDDNTVINIEDCDFSNIRSKYATVLYNVYQTNIQRSSFINLNSISAGAIAIKGFAANTGYVPLLNISDSVFINVSSSKNGGAILADMNGGNSFDSQYPYYGQLIISNTSFDNCRSLFGGAIAQFGGDLIINNTNFTNNNATYIGGAIYASNASVNVYNSLFENNTAVKDTFFETGGASNHLADSFGNFNSGAIYSDTGVSWIEKNSFTKNTGALSLYNNRYYGILDNVFKDNGIAIKTYFDNDATEIGTNTYNNDKNSLDNVVYDLNIDETGVEIDYDPIIITASADDPSFDLRDYGLVSPVDNQGKMGACWAFGTAGAIESAFLKATNKNLNLNISENNLKGVMLAYSILGHSLMTEGAAIQEPVSYLLSYLGIVNDTEDTFDELGKVSPIFLNKNTYHIQNLLMIPERDISNPAQCEEIDRQLKEALVKYGAVTVYILGAQAEGDGYNKNTFSQYVGDPNANGNHFVTLVGWDDNYSKDNFAPYEVKDSSGTVIETYTVKNNGSWIVKNSWGTDFGDDGFYYVSYEDTTFATSYSIAYIINQTPLYNTVYQYDFDMTGYVPVNDNYTVYFLADKDEIISAVGTYFNGTGIDYTISVLVGYDDVLAYKQSGKSAYSGYQTIELAKQIAVKKGDQFAISIKTSLSPYLTGSKIPYASGRSLMDDEDVIVDYGILPCLKAYAFANPFSAKLNYISSEKFTLTGPAGVSVTVEYDGANTTLTFDSSGKAVLNKALSLGDHMANVYYNGKAISFPIHVFKSVFMASSITCGYNTHLVLDSYFQNLDDLALKNTYVTVKLDGKSYSINTDGNGYIGITVDGLSIGSHTLTAINPLTKESTSCTIKVVSRFSDNKNIAMNYFDGTKFKLRVYGDNGKLVGAGQVVTFVLNKKTYRVKTDKNGWAILSIPKTVVPKKYTVTATYKGQTVKNTITVKQILKSTNRKLSKRLKKWILKATLKTSKKKGKLIKFKLKGKTYKAKTNSKGIAKVTIKKAAIKKLKKGKKYKVTISYLNDSIKKTITVKA